MLCFLGSINNGMILYYPVYFRDPKNINILHEKICGFNPSEKYAPQGSGWKEQIFQTTSWFWVETCPESNSLLQEETCDLPFLSPTHPGCEKTLMTSRILYDFIYIFFGANKMNLQNTQPSWMSWACILCHWYMMMNLYSYTQNRSQKFNDANQTATISPLGCPWKLVTS